MSPPFPQIIGYDEATWQLLGGQGKRANDFTTENFVASLRLDRTWVVTVLEPDDEAPDSAATWWNDHCDDDGRILVRGKLPFQAIAAKRNLATRLIWQVQKEYFEWVRSGCPMIDAA